MTKAKTNYARGHFAEKMALWYLRAKGYRLVQQNVVTGRGTGAGEVDLIMRKGKTLIFVEVKCRPTLDQARHAITLQNQMRVARGSAAFLARHPQFNEWQIRYDAVFVVPRHWPRHMKNAWGIL